MTWSTRLLATIRRAFSSSKSINLDALEGLDPDRIYVENVRSLLNVSHGRAREICEIAVAQGVFNQYVGVTCPDGSMPVSARDEAHLPSEVRCFVEEEGFTEEVMLATASLPKVVFYRLVDDGAL